MPYYPPSGGGGSANSGGLAGTGIFVIGWSGDTTLSNEKILTAGSSITVRTDATSIYIDAITGGASAWSYGTLSIGSGGTGSAIKPVFAVNLNGSDQRIQPATFTLVNFSSKYFDRENNYSTSASAFIAPVSGIYEFGGQFGFLTLQASKDYSLLLYVNSARRFFGPLLADPLGGGVVSPDVNWKISLAAGDSAQFYCYHEATTVQTISGSTDTTMFHGSLIRQ